MPTIRTILPQQKNDVLPLLRVAAYCRVSSDSDDQAHSFGAQTEYYTQLIGENPLWTLADIYADEGITGTSMKKRDEFNRMIADCKRGKIDRILTKSVSRFARNTVDCLDTVRMLSGLGISVLFEKEQIDTAKMSSEVLLGFMSTQAQDESISISGNMSWSYEKRMKNGTFICCTPPLGYDWVGGGLVINESEAEFVRMIFQKYLAGEGKTSIARDLNRIQVPHRYGGTKWHHYMVDYILKNERYVGDALLQKKYTTDNFSHQRKPNRGERTKYYVENCHEPIISRDTFDRAQQLLKQRSKTHVWKSHSLTGLLRCPTCGRTFRMSPSGNFWRCSNRNSNHHPCQPIELNARDTEAALMRIINILFEQRKVVMVPMIAKLEQLHSKETQSEQRLFEINGRITNLNNQIHTLTQLQTQGILDAADFIEQNRLLSDQLSSLRSAKTALLGQGTCDDGLEKLRELDETLAAMDAPITFYDESLVRAVVEKVIPKSNTEIEVHLFGGLILVEQLPETKRRCQRK